MINIDLIKIETRKDAEYPQESRYPSGRILKTGFIKDININRPLIIYNKVFNRHIPTFVTSEIENIVEEDNNYIILTKNSKYLIIIKK